MTGYITRKNNNWYVVIYQGLDPATGKERRTSTPAFTMATYQHVLLGMQAQAAAMFANLLDHAQPVVLPGTDR